MADAREEIVRIDNLCGSIHEVIKVLERHRQKSVEDGFEHICIYIDGSLEITGRKTEEDLEEKHGVKFVPEQFD